MRGAGPHSPPQSRGRSNGLNSADQDRPHPVLDLALRQDVTVLHRLAVLAGNRHAVGQGLAIETFRRVVSSYPGGREHEPKPLGRGMPLDESAALDDARDGP